MPRANGYDRASGVAATSAMIEQPPSVVALLSALQALLGLGLGTLFAYYYRVYRRPHLRFWSASFYALALFLVGSAAALLLARGGADAGATRTTASMLSQVAVYVHVATLVLGTLALRGGIAPPSWLVRSVLAAAVALGVTATLAYAFDPSAMRERVFMRVGLRYFVAAATYLGVAVALLAGQPWRKASVGQRIVALAFLAFSLVSLLNFAAIVSPVVPMESMAASPWLNFVDLAAVGAIGTGLVVWLHDDERRRAEGAAGELERLTFFDPRTGLPNRRLFVERLVERLIEADVRGERLAVLVARPDRVRALRAALDDAAVDALVARLAVRLGEWLGTGALMGRLDDDRLVLVLAPVADAGEAGRRADALLGQLGLALTAPGGSLLPVTCSLGLAQFPADGDTAEALVAAASAAQSGAAAAGGNRWAPFSRNLGNAGRENLLLEAELRRALDAGELEVHYQPMVDRDGRIVAAEALLRWRHPRRGLLLPGEFLAAAEGGNLLSKIDRFVLGEACRCCARRAAAGAPVRIAVNIAAQTFETPGFAEGVAAELAASGVPARLLELEITEGTAMRDLEQAARIIERIRALGVALALDDFGVGYSSMSQLRHLAADTLKIDQSFTAGVESQARDAAIASALVQLGHSLGLRVVAEGIEREGQVAFFRERGADLLQGYLLARPLPEPELARLLAAGRIAAH